MKTHYDVVIIGAGPAGLAAALFLKRANINCCIIEKNNPGGSLLKEKIIDNYPGVLKTSGVELAKIMLSQVNEYGIPYINANVLNVNVEGNIKNVVTNEGVLGTEFVIIATGRRPNSLGLDKEDELVGNGISYSDINDAKYYKDKEVIVVGDNDQAVEGALYLSNFSSNVTLFCENEYLKAKDVIQENLKYVDNIKILYNIKVNSFVITGEEFSGIDTNQGVINASGCFILKGFIPLTEPFKDLGILNSDGYVDVDKLCESKVKGVYAIGDAVDKKVYETTTAVSDATIAAESIIRKLT